MPNSRRAEDGCGAGEADEVACPRRHQAGFGAVRAAEAEIDQNLVRRRQQHPRGLGGDQGLKMQNVDQSLTPTNCACGSGAVTRRIGSLAKNTVPSGMACTSPLNRNVAR